MDVLQFLKADHDSIRAGLEELTRADGIKVRRALVEPLSRNIQAHLLLERDYLYPEITDLFTGAAAQTAIGLANASVIGKRLKVLVKLAAKATAEQDGWAKRLEELRDSMISHLDHEEAVLLPKMRYLIRTEDREDLGQVFLDVRDDVMASLEDLEGLPDPSPAGRTRKRA